MYTIGCTRLKNTKKSQFTKHTKTLKRWNIVSSVQRRWFLTLFAFSFLDREIGFFYGQPFIVFFFFQLQRQTIDKNICVVARPLVRGGRSRKWRAGLKIPVLWPPARWLRQSASKNANRLDTKEKTNDPRSQLAILNLFLPAFSCAIFLKILKTFLEMSWKYAESLSFQFWKIWKLRR